MEKPKIQWPVWDVWDKTENGINRNLFGNRRRLAVYSREIQFYGLKIEKNFSKKHDL